jgi:hypothetical protein
MGCGLGELFSPAASPPGHTITYHVSCQDLFEFFFLSLPRIELENGQNAEQCAAM